MKKKFSKNWIGSKLPRKQRKYRANAPLHIRRKMLSSMLDEKLKKEFNKNSVPIRKGDEVVIMRGEFKGKTGNVLRIDTKNLKVYIDGIKRKKTSGQEIEVPIDPSNLKITKLTMEDRMRRKFIDRKKPKIETKK